MTVDRYAVMGNPIAHSKSPFIHARFAEQTAQTMTYEAMLVPEDGFDEAVADFFNGGGKGLNITVPFKEQAYFLVEGLSEEARRAGAVNTLFQDASGRLQGHNSDGIGLVRDIVDNQGGPLAGRRVLILGAGGASRGILLPLLREKPAEIVVANRREERAQDLVASFNNEGNVAASGFDALAGKQFDWVLNATSAGLQGELPPLPGDLLAEGAWCYDLMYSEQETAFCAWAREHGAARSIDGLGMLVEQAAESFAVWRGVRPRTTPVINLLRKM